MEQEKGQGTRLKRLINESNGYVCFAKRVPGHIGFMDATTTRREAKGDIHIHQRDPEGSYRVYTSRGWGSVRDENYNLLLKWDGSTEDIVIGRVGGKHFALTVNKDGTLAAVEVKDEDSQG